MIWIGERCNPTKGREEEWGRDLIQLMHRSLLVLLVQIRGQILDLQRRAWVRGRRGGEKKSGKWKADFGYRTPARALIFAGELHQGIGKVWTWENSGDASASTHMAIVYTLPQKPASSRNWFDTCFRDEGLPHNVNLTKQKPAPKP